MLVLCGDFLNSVLIFFFSVLRSSQILTGCYEILLVASDSGFAFVANSWWLSPILTGYLEFLGLYIFFLRFGGNSYCLFRVLTVCYGFLLGALNLGFAFVVNSCWLSVILADCFEFLRLYSVYSVVLF